MIKVCGKGSFGVVRQVRALDDNQIYAIKTIPLQKKDIKLLNEGQEQLSLNEVEIMRDLEHPNIIRMHGSFIDIDFADKRRLKQKMRSSITVS